MEVGCSLGIDCTRKHVECVDEMSRIKFPAQLPVYMAFSSSFFFHRGSWLSGSVSRFVVLVCCPCLNQ